MTEGRFFILKIHFTIRDDYAIISMVESGLGISIA